MEARRRVRAVGSLCDAPMPHGTSCAGVVAHEAWPFTILASGTRKGRNRALCTEVPKRTVTTTFRAVEAGVVAQLAGGTWMRCMAIAPVAQLAHIWNGVVGGERDVGKLL